jgi:uncharacterized membrane protein
MNSSPDKEELERLWSDDANWSGWIYFCKKDPRFLVPKRSKWMGWTFNFGHRWGGPALLALIILPIIAMQLALIFAR